MKTTVNFVAFILALTIAPTLSYGASAPQTRKSRPKVKVTFDRENFQVSYGKTIDLCMKIVPKAKFTPLITFGSNPPGLIQGSFGGAATCPDATYSKIRISATLTDCLAEANLLIKVNNKTVATLPGTILLPDKVFATIRAGAGGCSPGEYGALQAYFIHFESTVEGSTPDFNGLTVTEHLDTDGQPNGCEILTSADYTPPPWTMGEAPAISNTIDDNNGKCGVFATTTCFTRINQTFTVGSCTTPVRTISVNIVNGSGTVTRSDE